MIKLLKNFTYKEWLIVIVCIVLTCVNVSLELRIPDYMSEITRLIQSSSDSMRHDILVQGSYMLLCSFGSLAAGIITGFLSAMLAARFSMDLQELLMMLTK